MANNMNLPAFPVAVLASDGLTKLEYAAIQIFARGDADAYESVKAAVVILQACQDVAQEMPKES